MFTLVESIGFVLPVDSNRENRFIITQFKQEGRREGGERAENIFLIIYMQRLIINGLLSYFYYLLQCVAFIKIFADNLL